VFQSFDLERPVDAGDFHPIIKQFVGGSVHAHHISQQIFDHSVFTMKRAASCTRLCFIFMLCKTFVPVRALFSLVDCP
jgi:hypothetical protein